MWLRLIIYAILSGCRLCNIICVNNLTPKRVWNCSQLYFSIFFIFQNWKSFLSTSSMYLYPPISTTWTKYEKLIYFWTSQWRYLISSLNFSISYSTANNFPASSLIYIHICTDLLLTFKSKAYTTLYCCFISYRLNSSFFFFVIASVTALLLLHC